MMSLPMLLGQFFLALTLVSLSGFVLGGQIERLGARLHFTPGLLGVAVAFGADSPELSSAISALVHGQSDVAAGVVLGSNIFNLAVLLGVSAIVSKDGIQVGRAGLLLSGGAALLVTLFAVVLVLGWLPPWLAFVFVCFAFVPYVWLSSLHEAQLKRWPFPEPIRTFLLEAVYEVERDARPDDTPRAGGLLDALSVIPALVTIVGGSFVVVARSITLGERWHVPGALLGTLVLAGLTGVPNLVAAVHLARRGRGPAVLSETLNSNSLNVVFGLCMPALILGVTALSGVGLIALVWLPLMTLLTLVVVHKRRGLHRVGGAALLVLYAAFTATVVWVSF